MNIASSFQNTMSVSTGLLDFQKLPVAALKTKIVQETNHDICNTDIRNCLTLEI